ncbi:Recombinational DNA repair protein RecT (prophage associated) [Labilithrix luteola]|uniref:Recombinational DNA repair protein RecT (Prophage associated) n=1 Tax=Labilithrix luteola TaxID=1391654 RepID=A0A0K1QBQ7_9BACT|nr:recombinase RecT [Labilithrix luteola]AKV03168.1 Recombinational DNA repair protein RecT (prophage associated) [Labilithrix luteola]
MASTEMTRSAGAAPLARRGGGDLKEFLGSDAVRKKLAEAAGKVMRPEDLIRFALVAASRTPDLAKCSKESVLRSLLDSAALNIMPGGLMGRGYLVPRKNTKNNTTECHFDPGWRGLIDIARRGGKVRRIEAHVVHAADVFSYERSPLTTLHHVPSELDDPGEIRAAYAVAEFVDGGIQIEVVTRRDLNKIRAMGAKNGPWSTWGEEMARKTAVRRLCKYLPYDPLLERAMHASDESDVNAFDEVVEVTAPKKRRRSLDEKVDEVAASMLPPAEPDSQQDLPVDADFDEADDGTSDAAEPTN